MAKSTLRASSPLEAFEFGQGNLLLRELPHFALVSLATGEADQAQLAKSLKAQFELTLPSIGHSTSSEHGALTLMGLQSGLWLLLFEHPLDDPVLALRQRADGTLPATTRMTDQSDAWVFLELSGPDCKAALERLCPIDLHPDTFEVGHLARTVVELMGVILMRTDTNRWMMMSARSTASSFIHAVSTAVESVT